MVPQSLNDRVITHKAGGQEWKLTVNVSSIAVGSIGEQSVKVDAWPSVRADFVSKKSAAIKEGTVLCEDCVDGHGATLISSSNDRVCPVQVAVTGDVNMELKHTEDAYNYKYIYIKPKLLYKGKTEYNSEELDDHSWLFDVIRSGDWFYEEYVNYRNSENILKEKWGSSSAGNFYRIMLNDEFEDDGDMDKHDWDELWVRIKVKENTSIQPRRGWLQLGGTRFNTRDPSASGHTRVDDGKFIQCIITQKGAPIKMAPATGGIGWQGGEGSLAITPPNNTESWQVWSLSEWITISPGSASGTGSATVKWKATPWYSSDGRAGKISVMGQEYIIYQNGAYAAEVLNEAGERLAAYESLSEAAENAPSGATIRMIENSEEHGVVFPQGKSLTLDLNGYSITSDVNTVTVRGELTVVDSSNSQLDYRQRGFIYGNAAVTVEQGGKFYLRDGTLDVTAKNKEAVSVYDGEFVMFGGQIGSFRNNYYYKLYPYIKVHDANGKASIFDGDFFDLSVEAQGGGKITLYGGKYYGGCPSADYILPGYRFRESRAPVQYDLILVYSIEWSSSSSKSVKTTIEGVDVYFNSVSDAFELAPDGSVLTMVSNEDENNVVLTAGKSFTLDFNEWDWRPINRDRGTGLTVNGALKMTGDDRQSKFDNSGSDGLVVGDGGRLEIAGGMWVYTGVKMGSANAQLFVTGGEFRYDLNNDAGGKVALYGGIFYYSYKDSWAPYVAPGYEMVKEEEGKWSDYIVQPKAGMAAKVINEFGYAEYYAKVQEAIDAAPSGGTVAVLMNVTEKVVVGALKKIRLECNEGSIVSPDETSAITVRGELTLVSKAIGLASVKSSKGTVAVLVESGGRLVVDGPEIGFQDTGSGSQGIEMVGSATVEILSGTVYKVLMKDGSGSGGGGALLVSAPQTDSYIGDIVNESTAGTATLADGNFGDSISSAKLGLTRVYGGRFAEDPALYVAAGYVSEIEGEHYFVKRASGVDAIEAAGAYGSVSYYSSVGAAMKGAEAYADCGEHAVTVKRDCPVADAAVNGGAGAARLGAGAALRIDLAGRSVSAAKPGADAAAAIVVEGGTLTVEDSAGGGAVSVKTGTAVEVAAGEFVLKGGTVSGGKKDSAVIIRAGGAARIEGGAVEGAIEIEEGGALEISGGVFDYDYSQYCSLGYLLRLSEEDGKYHTINGGTAIVGFPDGREGFYDTVGAAVAAAESGSTIKVLRDSEEDSIKIPAGKSPLTIDMNGRTLRCSDGYVIEETRSDLRIVGSGRIGNADGNGGISVYGCTLTMDGDITIECGHNYAVYCYNAMFIMNGGTIMERILVGANGIAKIYGGDLEGRLHVNNDGSVLTRLSAFEGKTPLFPGIWRLGLHYNARFHCAGAADIRGGGCWGRVKPSLSRTIATSSLGST